MQLLIGCEVSGRVRDAFTDKGIYAISCDLIPSTSPRKFPKFGCLTDMRHIVEDVKQVLLDYQPTAIIMHPPCTGLSLSGNAHYAKGKPKHHMRIDSIQWTIDLWELACDICDFVCMENPTGVLNNFIGAPTQTVQPYEFGDDASKKTCFWLKGFPLLKIDPRQRKAGRLVWVYKGNDVKNGKWVECWSNQTDSGQNRLGPSETRAVDRAITYPGIANAMADQWSKLILTNSIK